ncbi:FAD/NAD-binding domain-containing protein [Phanerochaete sordida]|uniref:FAD/NAD-binding domain-containing protein n=1 Tax=Phanerochaete sordida TaxID=48140 RepID=A0A9P3LCL1_9APHY|nr:FAD/NAD-binding domain-containing protein [Phanerochaete sordida]
MTLKIAVCGGGISGLSLALVLKRFASPEALTLDIYEAGPVFTEIGAGITVWHRTRSIFASLGIEEALKNRVVSPPFTLRKSDTKEPFGFHTMDIPHGSMALPRIDMIKLLVDSLQIDSTPWLHVHFRKRLESYEQDATGVTLRFADGSTSRADVLVGADGIGSHTRKTMYADIAGRVAEKRPDEAAAILQGAQPTWTGTYAYRTLLDAEELRAVSPENVLLSGGYMWCGNGQHVISYPISKKWINFLVFDTIPGGLGKPLAGPSVSLASKDELTDLYKDWEDDLCVAMENIGDLSKWAISHIRGLPQYNDERVALCGDSAHAMSTHFGAGAGQAIDDSYILGRILAHPSITADNIAEALKTYDAIRRPIAGDVLERSLRIGFLYEFHPEHVPTGTDLEKVRAGDRAELRKIADELQDIWRFHWEWMPERDWERAQVMLEEWL